MNRERLIADTFVGLADTLVDEFDALDLLHTLTDRSVELLDADVAGLILSDQRGQLQVVASTSHGNLFLEVLELQSSEGPCFECFSTGLPVVNVDLDEAAARWPRFTEVTVGAGFRSTHSLPLRLRDDVIGAMTLCCVERSTLGEEDLALGQALADVATIGLLQERAVRQQELIAEQLQTALNSRVLIEQAKGILSERARVDVEDAFSLMRALSRSSGRPLQQVAIEVIAGTLNVEDLSHP